MTSQPDKTRPVATPILDQSPVNNVDKANVSEVSYSLAVGSLMFAMVFRTLGITQAKGAIDKYVENLGRVLWTIQVDLRYLKGTSPFYL